jgi:hypothetical protein
MKWLEGFSSDESFHIDPELPPHTEVEGKHILSPDMISGRRALFGNMWWSRI